MILDKLRKAGIQNTRKEQRLKFDRLDPFAGNWLHATGDHTDKDGKLRRATVCIGPEHGTVGPDLVKEAAKEAVQRVGFDLLILCGERRGTAVELGALRARRSADFSPPPAVSPGRQGSGLKSALLNSTAVGVRGASAAAVNCRSAARVAAQPSED